MFHVEHSHAEQFPIRRALNRQPKLSSDSLLPLSLNDAMRKTKYIDIVPRGTFCGNYALIIPHQLFPTKNPLH